MTHSIERIDIERETIGHVLKDTRLRVPIHQRSYAWQEEHVADLYQDLTKAIRDNEPEYFLGSMVLIKATDGRLEVNDGQQRLATSVILLAAIRDYFARIGDKKTSELVERDFLLSVDRKTHELLPRLQLNVEDNEYFVRPTPPRRFGTKKRGNHEGVSQENRQRPYTRGKTC